MQFNAMKIQCNAMPCRAMQVFELMNAQLQVTWTAHDGARVTRGTKFGTVRGAAGALLTAERIALNFMQRMSGIATATAAMVAQTKVWATAIGGLHSLFRTAGLAHAHA